MTSCVPGRNTCFELFGFDVLLNERLRPWLIEVNTCPALGTGTVVDKAVKQPMLAQLMHMVAPPASQKRAADKRSAQPSAVRSSALNLLAVVAKLVDVRVGSGAIETCAHKTHCSGCEAARMRDAMQARLASSRRCGTSGRPRWTVAAARAFCFDSVPAQELPEVVTDSEAEWARRGCWQRCLPDTEAPRRHEDLFEHERWEDVLLRRWLERERAQLDAQLDTGQASACSPRPLPARSGDV